MGHYTASMKRVKGIAERMEGRMGWTREKPKEPGWYWWETVNGLSVVRIINTDEGGLLIQFEGGHVTHLRNVTMGEWQGPITPEP